MSNGHTVPTGNVVIDPDSIWNADGSKKDRSERRPVNPQNIAEDQYQGGRLKGRKKFGKVFDDEAVAGIAEDAERAAQLAEDTQEDEELPEEIQALLDEEDGEEVAQALNMDELGSVLNEIKILSAALRGGDNAADESLLNITQAEYSRPGGPRPQVRGALSALGYKKPAR